ncbi:glycoside hydrolase family 68 protein [Sphingobium chungbukense]|uniref:Levansucrase n=1 Tax=Sphingobium chungbukense TaxID=56193 RepID=A0A0M3AI94_9SPHN|nr:glycoside hydrolase family 68 protein [Sphingobium chungbukense]KKW89703.1 levansucrase [Sphingobium chungbukense]
MTNLTFWTANHVAALTDGDVSCTARIAVQDVIPICDELGIWDAWPIQHVDGHPYRLPEGREIWMALGAPRFDDPDDRHGHARIHLILREAQGWRHLGPAMPETFSPGSREWSGSAVVGDDGMTVTLYFTATGRRGEAIPSFEQRIFSAEATLDGVFGDPRLIDWRGLREIVERDPAHYMSTLQGPAIVGQIKAFRDPAFFRDPIGGSDYLFFAGSCASSQSSYNGVVGVAVADKAAPTGWSTISPVISADGLNNELERPHVIHRDGFYYLFWSTQKHVFDPAGPVGPTGLYGMVSEHLLKGWRPINGTGLVFANPPEAPAQAYSWLVLPDLSVTSFVDDWRVDGDRSFGGTFAPFVRLKLQGDNASLEG